MAYKRRFFGERRHLLITAVAVTLVHLVLVLGIHQILADLLFDSDEPDSDPVSVAMIQLPSAPMRPPTPPPAPAPALIPASPQVEASPQRSLEKPSPDSGGAENVDFASRSPRPEELPRSGAIAIAAFWGEFQSGTNIAKGAIEIVFPSPDRYEIRLVTRATGWAKIFATEPLHAKTEGPIGPGGFKPERYSHRSPRGKEELTVFDYEKNKISYTSLKEPLPLLKGIQDRLSFMLQLAWMLKVSPDQFGIGESIYLPMAGRNKVEEVIFTVLSDSEVILPGGVLVSAVHLSTFRAGERFSGQIDVWLDRADRLLPVRIRFEEKRGQVLDLLAVREP